SSFDEFEGNEILSERDIQDYRSMYFDLYEKYRRTVHKESINDDIIFEVELVKQVEVNIDYILMLISKFHQSNCKDKEVLVSIDKAISSSLELRSKKELIENFIATINTTSDIQHNWSEFVQQELEKDLDEIIAKEKLNAKETKKFIADAFRIGQLKTTGTGISKIMPPISRFGKTDRSQKKRIIIEKLESLFSKYYDSS
ncbi:MAG: type I restriction endonuclease subunit R, partial [archaeon]|nr:type I restriction endonuclease subunit R [archaeon]